MAIKMMEIVETWDWTSEVGSEGSVPPML